MNVLINALPAMPNLQRGACLTVDPDLFFDPHTEHAAKQVCRRCPVLKACLSYALTCREKHGVWGGTTEAERQELLTGMKWCTRTWKNLVLVVFVGFPYRTYVLTFFSFF